MGRRSWDEPLTAKEVARMVAAKECGARVQDIARRFDRSVTWVQRQLSMVSGSSQQLQGA